MLAAAVVLALALALVLSQSAPARARAARSGTIVGGVLSTSPAWDCRIQPECLAWPQSGCSHALAGRDPAWMAAIVDVADLADGRTPRTIAIRRGAPGGVYLGGAYVQFWRRDCTEVHAESWHSFWAWHG